MTVVPTKRMWLLLCLGVPFGAAVYQLGQPWLLFAYNAVLILAGWITAAMAPRADSLRIKRRFDPVLSVRVPNLVKLELENDGVEPIQGRLRDEGPARATTDHNEFSFKVEPGRVTEVKYHTTPLERGSDLFRGTFVRLDCPLGLVQRQERLATEQPVRIYPNVLAFKEFDLLKQKGKLNQMGIRKSRARGLGMEFESLREYTLGDDYRKIDWKATARKGGLVVREFEREKNQPVIICIDIGRRMLAEVNGTSKLDHVLDACLMLAHAVASSGDLIGLLVYSDMVHRYIAPRKGKAQVGFIIEAIHDLAANPVETDFAAAFSYLASRWKRRSLLINFTDLEDPDQSQELINTFGPIAKRNIALVARVSDPNLAEVAHAGIRSKDDMFLKAAALTFTDDRKRAGTRLNAADIHQLDAEPQDLAVALVSFYFMVKERSLL